MSPINSGCGIDRFPVNVPPLAKMIVNVVFTGSKIIAPAGIEAENVPFPILPVKFAEPETPKVVPELDVVAFTVRVVLIVAAFAAAHTNRAEANSSVTRVMFCLESSTLRTQKIGES